MEDMEKEKIEAEQRHNSERQDLNASQVADSAQGGVNNKL